MPINGNKVKFTYINSTNSYSTDNDTIYLDNIKKQVKIGSNVIASNTHTLIILPSYSDNTISATLDGQTINDVSVFDILNYKNTYGDNLKIYFIYQPSVGATVLLNLQGYFLNTTLIFSGTIDMGDGVQSVIEIITSETIDDTTITTFNENITLLNKNKKNLMITLTDDDDITHQHTTAYKNFSNVTLSPNTSWADWFDALQNPNDYNLTVKWIPNSIITDNLTTSYNFQPVYYLTQWSIEEYSGVFVFTLPIFSTCGPASKQKNDILEIDVFALGFDNGAVDGRLRTDFKLQFKFNGNFSYSTPTALTPYTEWQNISWDDVENNKDNLTLELYGFDGNTPTGEFVSCKTYNYWFDGNSPTIDFGPIYNDFHFYGASLSRGTSATIQCYFMPIS